MTNDADFHFVCEFFPISETVLSGSHIGIQGALESVYRQSPKTPNQVAGMTESTDRSAAVSAIKPAQSGGRLSMTWLMSALVKSRHRRRSGQCGWRCTDVQKLPCQWRGRQHAKRFWNS